MAWLRARGRELVPTATEQELTDALRSLARAMAALSAASVPDDTAPLFPAEGP